MRARLQALVKGYTSIKANGQQIDNSLKRREQQLEMTTPISSEQEDGQLFKNQL